ncbi:MAG TPA: M42 family peptidase, partial [Clostridiales bacterium]|nr:M42 family peptidase [Clostridiales bacterium]
FACAPSIPAEKCAKLGGGTMIGISPVLDRKISKKLENIAKEKGIDYQLEVMGGRTGTNADSIQNVAEGVKMGLLSIPLRNMHTAVELVDLHDIECTARLMAEYILQRGCRNA